MNRNNKKKEIQDLSRALSHIRRNEVRGVSRQIVGRLEEAKAAVCPVCHQNMVCEDETSRRGSKKMNNCKQNGHLYFHGLRGEIQVTESADDWKREILRNKVSFPTTINDVAWIEFFEESKSVAQRYLSPAVRDLLNQFANPFSGIDAVVISNLPHVDPGPVPQDGRRPIGKRKFSEMVLAGLIASMGLDIFGFLQEKEGTLVHQVTPIKGHENEHSNASRGLFGWHTDDGCFYPFAPEFLFLSGLINESVATLILTIDDILSQTKAELIATMREEIFTFFSPISFDFKNGRCVSTKRPVIYTDSFGIDRIALPSVDSIQFDSRAQKALQAFHTHLNTLAPHKIVIRPGVICGFRNDRCIHGREPIPGNNDRWLQRFYATSDIAKYRRAVRTHSPEFVFDARLLFGQTQVNEEQPMVAPEILLSEVLYESIGVQ